jgi:hypothetical protein
MMCVVYSADCGLVRASQVDAHGRALTGHY